MMPFRIPMNYYNLRVQDDDDDSQELAAYVAWLEKELALAKLAFDKQRQEEGRKED